MKKTITILALILIPAISNGAGGAAQDMELGVEIGQYENSIIASTSVNQPNDGVAIGATSTTEVESDGFFRRVINWFKGLFN